MKNREIKFRVWNGSKMELNIMVGFLGAFYVQGMDEKYTNCMSHFNTKYSPETPVMQYTGMKDKNGKEIWEGDIVNAGRMHHGKAGTIFKAYIIYNEHIGSFRIAYDSLGGGSQDEIYFRYEIEVIGNIYENRELLTTQAGGV